MSRNAYMKWDEIKSPHFWIQVMFSVFRGPKYDDIRPNHTKKIQKRPKNAKKRQNAKKHKIALQ